MKRSIYKKTKHGITKDGNTMFDQDIVKELNRKSYLESIVADARAVINKYFEITKEPK